MKVNIREATDCDLPGILGLYNQPNMNNGNVLPIEHAQFTFNKIKSYPNYKIYVAMIDDDIVGTFALAIMDNLAHLGAPSGLVEDVVVKANMQNKGIGKEMMKYAMDCCRNCGCYKLALSSNLKRENAHHFYESLGFKKHGYSFLLELENEK